MMLLRLAPLVLPLVDPELYGSGGWSSPKLPDAELDPRGVVERGVEPESERGVNPPEVAPGPTLARLRSCLEVWPTAIPTPTTPSSRERPLMLEYGGAGGAGGSLPAPPPPLPLPSPSPLPLHHSDEAALDEGEAEGVLAALAGALRLASTLRPPSPRPFWAPFWLPVSNPWCPLSCTWLTEARRALGGPLAPPPPPPPPPPLVSNGVLLGGMPPPVGLLRV